MTRPHLDFPKHQVGAGEALWVCPVCWAALPPSFAALEAHLDWHDRDKDGA